MDNNHVTVVYKWTAQPDKLDELTTIYAGVTEAMEQNEPGAEAVHVYRSDEDNALYVRDEFADADAVAFHLTSTAAQHFGDLLAIATPGPFYFFGDVPAELRFASPHHDQLLADVVQRIFVVHVVSAAASTHTHARPQPLQKPVFDAVQHIAKLLLRFESRNLCQRLVLSQPRLQLRDLILQRKRLVLREHLQRVLARQAHRRRLHARPTSRWQRGNTFRLK